jgi:hypothetical protein
VRHQEAGAASTLNSMRNNGEYGIRNKSCNKVNENFNQRMMITGLQVAIDLAVALIDAAVLLRRVTARSA